MTPSIDNMLDAAANGAVVLTANKRLARHLREQFAGKMRGLGHKSWISPQILSFDAWTVRALEELGQAWRLIDGFTALRLWEKLIEENSEGDDLELLQTTATARRAQQAHQLLTAYDCANHSHVLTRDQQVFLAWRERFMQVCQQKQWLDKAEAARLVVESIDKGSLPVADQIFVCGFDQWTPDLENLKRATENRGKSLKVVPTGLRGSGQLARQACPDALSEIETVARWARALLDEGATSIGVVVTDLAERRSAVERVFRHQIEPESALQTHDKDPLFGLSLGAPLIDQGAVHAALEILAVGSWLPIEQASFLLRTPYLGGSLQEADARASLDSQIRSYRQKNVALKQLTGLTEKRAPEFSRICTIILEAPADNVKKMPGEWAVAFDHHLKALGWPGQRTLTSREFQVVKAWREKILPELATLDQLEEPVGRKQALALLRRLAMETEFQAESEPGPIQVLGILESAGLQFDHLWVMGATETNLPAPAQPNPFLPTGLQTALKMPHSGPERELEFAQNVIGRLKTAAPNVIFSYAQRRADTEVRPSPLIAGLPEAAPVLSEPHDAYFRLASHAPQLENLKDVCGPALAGEKAVGGTNLLKDQALCPFRAFAHSRLLARAIEPPQPGLDARTRGDLLHKSLEGFWNEVRSKQSLAVMDARTRHQVVVKHVSRAIAGYFAQRVMPNEKILELEGLRLEALIEEWLVEVETNRPDFVVEATEQEQILQIGNLAIKTIIDRIDQIEGRYRVILDYKTGLMKLDELIDERLLEPQLPVYTTADNADAVAFAQVRRGACKLLGVARNGDVLPKVGGVSDNKNAQDLKIGTWLELLDYWRTQLEQLAEQFVAGHAEVDPVDVNTACKYCDLAGLCRIAEARTVAAEVQPKGGTKQHDAETTIEPFNAED